MGKTFFRRWFPNGKVAMSYNEQTGFVNWRQKRTQTEAGKPLYEAFDAFNDMFFNNELPRVRLYYNKALRACYGKIHYQVYPTTGNRKLEAAIDISPTRIGKEIIPGGFLATLLHEMVHLWTVVKYGYTGEPGGDRITRAKMDAIGASYYARGKEYNRSKEHFRKLEKILHDYYDASLESAAHRKRKVRIFKRKRKSSMKKS